MTLNKSFEYTKYKDYHYFSFVYGCILLFNANFMQGTFPPENTRQLCNHKYCD